MRRYTAGPYLRYQAPTSAQAGARRAALEIHEALPDQPAEKAGVKAGDLLLSFDGHPIRHSNNRIDPPHANVPMLREF